MHARMPPSVTPCFSRRWARLCNNPDFQYKFVLGSGDFVFYDNHQMFHARHGFRGARWMRGVYFDEIKYGET